VTNHSDNLSHTRHFILALDPGKTTGFCRGEWNGDKGILVLSPGEQQFTAETMMGFLHDNWQKNFTLIYEGFSYRNAARPGLDLTPVELIGVIKLFCQSEKVTHYEQTPAVGKGYWTDEQLKRFQVYVAGLRHGRDAMRHLLHWWQFKAGYKYHEISPFTNYEVLL